MKKNKNKTAQEPKAREQFLINISGTTIAEEVVQKFVTNLQDNNLLFGHRI